MLACTHFWMNAENSDGQTGPCPHLDLLSIFSRRLRRHVDTIRIPVRRQAGPPGPSKHPKRRGAALTLRRRAWTSGMQRLTKPLQPQLTDGPPASSSPAASTAMPTLSTLNATSDVNSSRPAALSQPAAFLSSAHDTVRIPATFKAVSDAESSGLTAASQPAFVAAMSTTTKFHAVSDAKSCGPSAVSQPGAFPVATTAAAGSVPTAVPPDAKSCSLSSTSQPAALLAADSTGSTTPPVLANANSMSANDTPNFPSPTASQADDSSAEMDFTASPENNHNTPTPESAWSTVGTSRKPASTARPRTELISVGIQLPPGTLTPKLPLYDLLAAIISAAHLSSKTSAEITLQAKPAQSLVFLKTHSPLTAHLLLSLTHLQLNGKPISVKTYAPNPPISCLGVIHNVGSHFTPAQLMHDLESFTTDILAARMMGTTESVLITFAGTVIPHFVYFKRVAFRCRPHKPKPPTCTRCLALGHRAHQCPQHSVPAKCRRCAAPLPADSTAHVCAQPWCIHCQVNTHSSLDPTCPFLLAKQRECAKAAFLRRTALRRATQATPSSASSSAHHESPAPPTPSPPGSYAATVKGSSASASLSSATIPSPRLGRPAPSQATAPTTATTGTPLASVYVRNDVLVEPLDIPSSLLKYLVGVVYYQPSSRISLTLISFYNPPVTCSLFTALGKFLHSLPSTTHLLLGGDFNAPHTLWGYPQTLKPGRLLHCLAQERHLTLLNNPGSPTRAGTFSQRSTTPDLTFSRGALSFHWQVTAETLLSDHFLIHITTTLSHIPRWHQVTHTDWQAFRTNLLSVSFESYDDWTSCISAAVSASSRRVRSRHPIPDPDPHFLRLWRRRKRLQRSFRSQPQNAQLYSRIAALRAEIVAHGASLEYARWSTLCDGLDSALHSRSTWSLFKSLLAGLSPAPEKSELLLLNHSAYQRSHNALICLHLSGSPIPIVSQCKVLGFPLHAAKNAHALHHAVTTCHSVTHLLRRVVTRRSGLHEAHACRVAHALALNKFLYFVPYVSFTNTQLNTLETALLGLYKAALNLPITTSTAKVFATGLFHPLRSLLSLHRDSQVARLSLTRQGQWLLAQAGISPIPVSTFTSPISTLAPNLRILPLPSNMSPVLHAGRRHAAAQHHVPPFTTQGVAYTDASFVAPRGSCGYAIYHPHLPAPETHTSGPFLHPPDALSLEVLAIAHALQSFASLPSLPEYTIYSDSQAAIHHIQNRTLPYSLQQEVERAVSALQPSTVFLRWVPGHSGINGNELAHQLARDASNRAPLIPWPKPSEDGGRLSLRRTIKEVYLQLRLDKRLYPPPHPSLTVPEARLLRHIQMNALITPSRLFLYRYRVDPSCPNCPSTYADLAHCLFHCPAAQQSHSYPPPSLSITTWLDWLGAEGEEEQRRLAAQAVEMLGL
ncbi:hypothetical protein HPB49_025847 [Dermacentor silvarum]|nr:hypothetical protein HPB49_025847 [Dermacentor silvarum]